MATLKTTVLALGGGSTSNAGKGQTTQLTVGGAWAQGDTFVVALTEESGFQTIIGKGNVSGVAPQFCYTFNNKVYTLGGATFFYSALADPTTWNDPNAAGNSFEVASNFFSTPENLLACAPYQGKLAIFTRRNVYIWAVDPDPALYAVNQTLQNIGTVAPLTVQAIGDLDVFTLADNGIRSIRVRDASSNAVISDVGTPIDALLQPLLASLTDEQKARACGIVDPAANRYWCYVPQPDDTAGKIYVFSYFHAGEIAAWSTYSPTYWDGSAMQPFIPEKFVVLNGQVWCRAGDKLLRYGGADNNTYDGCGMTVQLPYLNADAPTTQKYLRGVDCAIEGVWEMSVSADYELDNFKSVYKNNFSSFQLGRIPMNRRGTHFSVKFTESGAGYARLSHALVHFQANTPK